MSWAQYQKTFARVLRSTAHLAIALSWLLIAAAYLPDLLRLPIFSSGADTLIAPPLSSQTGSQPSGILVFIAGIAAILFIGFVLYVIGKVYMSDADRAVERMTEAAKREVLTTVQKRKPRLTKMQRRAYGRRTIAIVYAVFLYQSPSCMYCGRSRRLFWPTLQGSPLRC